jgi:hypothetical protein
MFTLSDVTNVTRVQVRQNTISHGRSTGRRLTPRPTAPQPSKAHLSTPSAPATAIPAALPRGPVHRVTLPPPPPLAPVDGLSPLDIVRELCAVTTQREAETMAALEAADAALPTFRAVTAPESPLALVPTPRGPGQMDLLVRRAGCSASRPRRAAHYSHARAPHTHQSPRRRRRRRAATRP